MGEEDNKFVCSHCGEEHPQDETMTFKEMAFEAGDKSFVDVWKKTRAQNKELSKKELAKEFFDYGIEHMFAGLEMFEEESKKSTRNEGEIL